MYQTLKVVKTTLDACSANCNANNARLDCIGMQDEAFAIGQLQRNVKWKLVRPLYHIYIYVCSSEKHFFNLKNKKHWIFFLCNNYVIVSYLLHITLNSFY